MSNTLTLTETELIKLIESTAREHLLEVERKNDPNFETKVRNISRRYGKLFEKYSKSSNDLKFEAWKNETIKLKKKGYSDNVLGEALTIHTALLTESGIEVVSGGGSWIREGIWKWILGFMGIEDERLKEAIAVPLGNVPFFELPKLMNCDYLVSVLSEGVMEYMLQLGVNKIMPDQKGMMTNAIRNVMAKTIKSTEMVTNVEEQLKMMVCGKLGQKKDQVDNLVKDKKQSESEPEDDWRSKAMGFVKDMGSKSSEGSAGEGKTGQWYDEIVNSVMAGMTNPK